MLAKDQHCARGDMRRPPLASSALVGRNRMAVTANGEAMARLFIRGHRHAQRTAADVALLDWRDALMRVRNMHRRG